MVFQWFDVLEIFQLPEAGLGTSSVVPGDWRSLSLQYIANIKINLDKEYRIRVDAVPLLYEFIIASSSLSARKDIDIQIGEGWWLTSEQISERSLRLKFEFVVGSDVDNLGNYEISSDDLVVFLATRISRIVDLLEHNGVDILSYLNQFPTALYKR